MKKTRLTDEKKYLHKLKHDWNLLAKADPLWAILTYKRKRGHRWNYADFFLTGEKEIARVFRLMETYKVDVARGQALDFGCGVGRLTRALAQRFGHVYGVDISSRMISVATKRNASSKNCQFVLNEKEDLKMFPNNSFDFVYSNITLQHIISELQEKYLRDFLRILRKNGLAVFQVAMMYLPYDPALIFDQISTWIHGKNQTYEALEKYIPIYGLPVAKLKQIIGQSHGELLFFERNKSGGPGWTSAKFFVRKN